MPMTPYRARQLLGCALGDSALQRQLHYNRIRRQLEQRLARVLNHEIALWVRFDIDQLAQALDTLDHEEERLTRGCPEPGDGEDPAQPPGIPDAFPSDPRGHRPYRPYAPPWWLRPLVGTLVLGGCIAAGVWVHQAQLTRRAALAPDVHTHP